MTDDRTVGTLLGIILAVVVALCLVAGGFGLGLIWSGRALEGATYGALVPDYTYSHPHLLEGQDPGTVEVLIRYAPAEVFITPPAYPDLAVVCIGDYAFISSSAPIQPMAFPDGNHYCR